MKFLKDARARFPYLKRKERIFVAHLLRDGMRIQEYVAYRDRAVIVPVGSARTVQRVTDLTHAVSLIKLSLPFYTRWLKRSAIFLLDPSLGTSVYGVVSVARDRAHEPISESDVENLISQGIWKMFDRERTRASVKMGIQDVDLALSDVRVQEVRLDDHRVIDPRGFAARTMSVRLMETFLPKDLQRMFMSIFPRIRTSFFAEGGAFSAHSLLSSYRVKESFLFLEIFSVVTDVFIVHGTHVSCVQTVPWGSQDFIKYVSEALCVSPTVARRIIERSLSGKVSPHFKAKLERVFTDACNALVVALEKVIQHEGASVAHTAVFSGFAAKGEDEEDVPHTMFSHQFKTRSGSKIRFIPFVREHEHASVDTETVHAMSAWDARARIAINHFFFSSVDDTLNKVARKRARWLRDALAAEQAITEES